MPFFDGISNKVLGAGASVFAVGFGYLTYAEWKSYREWRKSLTP